MKLTVKQSVFRDCGFRSRGEVDEALSLVELKQSGQVKKWQFEKHIPLVVKGKTVCEIWPDFFIEYPNGRLQFIEVKGGEFFKSEVWSIKKKLLQAIYPHIEYVTKDKFARANKRKFKNWKEFTEKNRLRVIQM